MKDEPEIIKILRKEELRGKIEKKPQEFEPVACANDVFHKKTVGSDSVISDIPVTKNLNFKFMAAVERQLENILGIKTEEADADQDDDQEFQTRLIGENDTADVPSGSMSFQEIQQVMEPPEKTKESPLPQKRKPLDVAEDLVSNDSQVPRKKNTKKADDERTGFGWKGLGSRVIRFDDSSKTYVYEVHEPLLEKEEQEIKNRLLELFELRSTIDVFEVNSAEKSSKLDESLQEIITDGHIKLSEVSKDKIFYYIFQEFTGYGKIDILMHDEGIEDISCDGPNIPIFIYHKTYESIKSNIVFESSDELDSFAVKLAQICGKQISIYEPIIDGKLADGSRLSVMLAKTVTPFSTFTIRRFREDPFTPIDLINTGTMSVEMAAYFWLAIENGASILFCGGTASGKTSTLNAFALFLPASYKIFSIEDTREVMLPHENWVASTTRTGFSQSAEHKTSKDIDMFDLTRAALRQRPQVVIVGEIRGQEAYALFQAMATGHISYSTIHASDIHTLVQRLENPPISLPKALLISLNLVVFLKSTMIHGKPARRIINVIEIIKMEPSTNKLIFSIPFSWISESDDHFKKEAKSILLDRTQSKKGWSDAQLLSEIKNRIIVLEWMRKNNLRSYKEVGKVVADYSQEPDVILKKAKGGLE
jgi:archaeal flagellar protein FlaI